MGLADRIRRLERAAAAADDGGRMTEAEMIAAEQRIRAMLDAYAAQPQSAGSPVSFETMRALIRDRGTPGWLQRLRAEMEPEDLFV